MTKEFYHSYYALWMSLNVTDLFRQAKYSHYSYKKVIEFSIEINNEGILECKKQLLDISNIIYKLVKFDVFWVPWKITDLKWSILYNKEYHTLLCLVYIFFVENARL